MAGARKALYKSRAVEEVAAPRLVDGRVER
jgi:hypothetical protein